MVSGRAKVATAGALVAVFAGGSAIATALLLYPDSAQMVVAYALGVIIGSFAYVSGFVALSVVTTRALVVGLAHTLLWEGRLAGILPGTGSVSLREAMLAIVDAVAPRGVMRDGIALDGALLLVGIVIAGGFGIAAFRLARYEVRGGD